MKAIVIGASSGIGRELAKILVREGYEVGVIARRRDLLISLQEEVRSPIFIQQADISRTDEAMANLQSLIQKMGDVDLAVISSGVGYHNPDLEWTKDRETIAVNVLGFCAMANVMMRHFLIHGRGHLVGISSIAALRGSGTYSASKAFVSNYMEGLRHQMFKEQRDITITDIQPGFVDTAMAKGRTFWMASAEQAAEMIYQAIQKKRTHAYITPRWRLIAWLLKWMPDFVYDRVF
jgi:short-subunit dehydrogenase